MAERIISVICCLLCAVPFFIISRYDANSVTPITFWSGDNSLKKKVQNIPAYNKEMAALYRKCAWAILAASLVCLISPGAGVIFLCAESIVGIYIVYMHYKKILDKHSRKELK